MTTSSNVNAGSRIGSMILDHFIMSIICMLFSIPIMIKGFAGAFTVSHQQQESGFSGPLFYLAVAGFSLYFCKDCINGRSIAKRILKMQVVNNSTGNVASPFRCFIRNIFCALWPIELIAVLIRPGRRTGDLVAGTRVVDYNPTLTEQPKTDIKQVLFPVVLASGLMILMVWEEQQQTTSHARATYSESSYNAKKSLTMEKLYTDSLGRYLSASVRIYDSSGQHNIKYISVIYSLKENYFEDKSNEREIRRQTMELLNTVYPQSSYSGKAKYVYSGNGSIQISSNSIGKGY